MKRTLAFLLTTGPDREDGATVLSLARAALGRGHDVRLFLMADGVEALRSGGLEDLFRRGAEVSVCAQSASARGIARVDWTVWGTQVENAGNLVECDRFLAFD